MNETCRVPTCVRPATAGDWQEPFGKFRWGVELSVTVADLAFTWPLCAGHAQVLLARALDAVGATLNEWNLQPGYQRLQ